MARSRNEQGICHEQPFPLAAPPGEEGGDEDKWKKDDHQGEQQNPNQKNREQYPVLVGIAAHAEPHEHGDTNYIGELVQHDSSHHHWSPYAASKWYLITSLDDYSRKLLYAELVEKETSWDHISALESVVLDWGAPNAYYTDCHSIFDVEIDRMIEELYEARAKSRARRARL